MNAISRRLSCIILVFLMVFSFCHSVECSQGIDLEVGITQETENSPIQDDVEMMEGVETDARYLEPGKLISLEFANADIKSVLRVLSFRTGMNIVAGPDVGGEVSISLNNVPWEQALDVLLKTYGYGYEKQNTVIIVKPVDMIKEQKKSESELLAALPLETEVINLKFIDAWDAREVLESQKSERGKIVVLVSRGLEGWVFGGTEAAGASGKRARGSNNSKEESLEYIQTGQAGLSATIFAQKMQPDLKSKTLIITDTRPFIDKIKETIQIIDIMPQQVLIQTKIIEVNSDNLKDLGLEYGTGKTGAQTSGDVEVTRIKKATSTLNRAEGGARVRQYDPAVTPSAFTPMADGLTPLNSGLTLMFRKLTGNQFQVILHALEERVKTNILSSPSIVALDNQEASILVGTKYPILESDVSGTTTTVTTASLDYYQDIGIQLNVVPQISGGNKINMIIHPAVTSFSETLKVRTEEGIILTEYPIIETREAETQILLNDGETVVIGGLLRDRVTKEKHSIPILGEIPWIGDALFTRNTNDVEKIDLLIFITAYIIKDNVQTDTILREKSDIGRDDEFENYVPNDLLQVEEAGEYILKR